jgi:hypothetical protein
MRQALDEASRDWIEDESHYDGNRRRGTLGCFCADRTILNDDVDFAAD